MSLNEIITAPSKRTTPITKKEEQQLKTLFEESKNAEEVVQYLGWKMTCEPLLEEEHIQRCYRVGYPQYAQAARKDKIDFSVIQEMLNLLEGVDTQWGKPYEHLIDARNERLPLLAREQHFDIAGAHIWQTLQGHPHFNRLMQLFMEGNGV